MSALAHLLQTILDGLISATCLCAVLTFFAEDITDQFLDAVEAYKRRRQR